jgi:GT2 family glycosyltransferase/exopolysaccharide biosynthesis predicted pyruvyltransferase EpsI
VTTSTSTPDIAASRQLILNEIGDPPDLTLMRGVGNRGDELIGAGVQELLVDRVYKEIELEGLCQATGHTLLLSGGGAFCRPYREIMPRALAVGGIRFERVIVLPSSFDPSEDEVREALNRTRATVFARETESYRRIVSLCDARLAHDCAFYFDFSPWYTSGRGTLNAFRTDRESAGGFPVPVDNDDISLTARTLEHWLRTIADHDTVRTDRAHVMIAAALLGKRVEFAPSAYHKVQAIADYALSDYPVSALATRTPQRLSAPKGKLRSRAPAPRVTSIVLSRDRASRALRAIDSLRESSVPSRVLVLDNNSAPDEAAELAAGCAQRDGVWLTRSDRNLGCAGGRRFALEDAGSEFVLFLDDDAELDRGALELLVAELDTHPDTAAVTATVLTPEGAIHHSGGWMQLGDGVADFGLIGAGQPVTSPLPPSGPADWVPGTAALIRRSVFEDFPIDEKMAAYYEDNEWCYRVELERPGSFRRSLQARAVHHLTAKHDSTVEFVARSHAVELLHAHARFYERHGLLLGVALFDLVPELRDAEGARDVAAARLLMELLLAKGTDWTLMEWMNGGLDGLLGAGGRLTSQRIENARLLRELAEREHRLAEQTASMDFLHQRHVALQRLQTGGWWRLRQRLLPALRVFWRLRGREEG